MKVVMLFILCICCVTNNLEFDEKTISISNTWCIMTKFHKHRVGFSNMKRMFVM